MKFEGNADVELINSFLFFLKAEKNLSQNTIVSYRFDLIDLLKFLYDAKKNFQTASYFDFIHFFEFLVKSKEIETSSQLRKTSVFYNFYEFLKLEKGFGQNPILEFERPKAGESLPIFLEREETEKLLQFGSSNKSKVGIRDYAILETLYSTGMRISECISLRLNQVLDKAKNPKSSFIITGKGERERYIFLNNSAKLAIKEYLEVRELLPNSENGFLFNAKAKNGHITRQNFFYSLKKIAYKAGLNVEEASPHKIRHSFATHMFLNGIDIRILQELLGHADISTTQIYTHINQNSLKTTVEEFHPFSSKK